MHVHQTKALLSTVLFLFSLLHAVQAAGRGTPPPPSRNPPAIPSSVVLTSAPARGMSAPPSVVPPPASKRVVRVVVQPDPKDRDPDTLYVPPSFWQHHPDAPFPDVSGPGARVGPLKEGKKEAKYGSKLTSPSAPPAWKGRTDYSFIDTQVTLAEYNYRHPTSARLGHVIKDIVTAVRAIQKNIGPAGGVKVEQEKKIYADLWVRLRKVQSDILKTRDISGSVRDEDLQAWTDLIGNVMTAPT